MAHTDHDDIPEWKGRLCITRGVPSLSESVGSLTAGPDPLDGPFKAVFARANKLWTSGATLTYAYIADPKTGRWKGTDRQHKKVDTIIKEWSIYANITFTRIEESKLADIRICFKPGESWSGVGTDIRNHSPGWFPVNEPTMNLGWVDNKTDTILPEDHGTILHEFGHTLGMEHEHQSPVRDSVLTLNKQLMYEIYGGYPNYWKPEEVDAQVIDVLTLNDVSNFSRLDFTSIMMYNMEAKLNREGIEIKRNHDLDDLDKAFMTINYPRLGANVTLPQGALPLEKALQIAGVTDEAVVAKILKSKDPSTVRFSFSAYNVEQQTKNLRFEKQPALKPREDAPPATHQVDENVAELSQRLNLDAQELINLGRDFDRIQRNRLEIESKMEQFAENPAGELKTPPAAHYPLGMEKWFAKKVPDDLPKITFEEVMARGRTGDILLFSSQGEISDVIKTFTRSPFSHVGLLYKGKLPNGEQLKEPALFHSTSSDGFDLRDNKTRSGEQMLNLRDLVPLIKDPVICYRPLQHIRQSREPYLDELVQEPVNNWKGEFPSDFNMMLGYAKGVMGIKPLPGQLRFCADFVASFLQRLGIMAKYKNISSSYAPGSFAPDSLYGDVLQDAAYDNNIYRITFPKKEISSDV